VRAATSSTRTAAQTWNATHEDPDIAADIQLLDMYIANLGERGASADTSISACGAENPYGEDPGYYYGDDQQVYGCSVGGNPRGLVLVLVAAGFVIRRRRH